MIKVINYRKLATKLTITVTAFSIVALLFTKTHAQSAALQEQIFTWEFESIENYGTPIHFNLAWNNFYWQIFWKDYINNWTDIDINQTAIHCNKQIRGLYYNPQRWERIWPLDQDSLALLQEIDSSYDSLTMEEWGLFFDCNDGTSEGIYNVYWQIIHDRNSIRYNIVAGVQYDFINNNYFTNFAQNLTLNNDTLNGYFFDNQWGISEISNDDKLYKALNYEWTGSYQASIDPVSQWVTISINKLSLNLNSDTTTGYLKLDGVNTLRVSENTWDGVLYPPTILYSWDSGYANVANLSGFINSITQEDIISTIFVWASGASLETINTGDYFEVSSFVLWWTTGETYSVLRSSDGITWSRNYPNQICELDAQKNCSFMSDHLSYFVIINEPTHWAADIEFYKIKNAKLWETYKSNEITVSELTSETLAEIDKWILYINDIPVWTKGMVNNGDTIAVELISSNYYKSETTSNIRIGEQTYTFRVITEEYDVNDDEVELSITYRLQLASVFNSVLDVYKYNDEKLRQFLYTFKSMLDDEIDDLDDEIDDEDNNEERRLMEKQMLALEYMLDMVDDELEDELDYDYKYTAPNDKIYTIQYDEDRMAYTAKEFKIKKYFATLDSIKMYIDTYNPGDGNYHQSSPESTDLIVAPNKRVYRIEKTDDWRRTSPDLVNLKYFDSYNSLKKYIDINNPEDTVWNHTLDTSWDRKQHVHTAPNGKRYEVFRTTKGQYGSYMFVKPKYFNNLDDIKRFIDSNNK